MTLLAFSKELSVTVACGAGGDLCFCRRWFKVCLDVS